jgi:hypothetical protein
MEQILHYVWKHKLFRNNMKTTCGLPVEVIDPGMHNTDGGPDFFNAKVKIDGELWCGTVEIHTVAGDWYKHRHHIDKAYNSVILHVVERADCEVVNELKHIIPQCEIVYPAHIKDNIDFLLNNDIPLPCCNYLKTFSPLHIRSWMNALLFERLERKANDIQNLLDRFNYSWADAFYVLLSRSMGFGLNSDAFERLALSLPLNFILKQGDNPMQIEAMIFGQAGLLQEITLADDYTLRLKQEYAFLKNKYTLTPLSKEIFRALRVRPGSSPSIRLAQLSALLSNIQGLYSRILESNDLGQARLLLHVNASEYWQTHYNFGEASARKNKYIGDSSLDVLIINAVVPIIFAYGKNTGDESYIEKAMRYLEGLKPESNSIVRLFATYGLPSANACDTQALIQLKREYCEKKKCLYCRIGYKVLSVK